MMGTIIYTREAPQGTKGAINAPKGAVIFDRENPKGVKK